MKVGLLECDDVVGRFPEVEGGYREMFAALLPDFAFEYYDAHRGALPASPRECDAWICSGSKYSVYEKHEWIDNLSGFIRRIPEENRGFVGICFGHQMLAHAMGGEVAKARQGWGIGVLPVEVTREEPWMQPPRRTLRLHHMHQDQVVRLPEKSVVLARSEHCPVEMFRIGSTLLGIEAHPEFTNPFSAALIRSRRERVGEERTQRALQSLDGGSDGAVVGAWIARFLRRS